MATTTPRLNLTKPDGTDLVDIAVINANYDKIDAASAAGTIVAQNYIINGDFSINQRNFISTTTDGYGFDRWRMWHGGGTATYSAQTFTPGTAPVSGYEAANYARIVTSGQSAAGDYAQFAQHIEDVRTFAGQTVTVSFWAKAASGTPKVTVELPQVFGSGGSPSGDVNTYAGQVTLSTSWVRYSVTAAIPSIAGKTIGTTTNSSSLLLVFWLSAGSNYNSRTGSIGIQNNTIDIWGVQVEVGSVMTAFRRNANSIQGELAACQRYYETGDFNLVWGSYTTGAFSRAVVPFKSTKRDGSATVTLTVDYLGTANTPTVWGVTAYGFSVQSSSTGTYVAAEARGSWTASREL